MHIRIGDIVRFISEKLEGKVTGLIDQNTVNVYCEEYGFEIPASLNDLVVIQSDFNTDTDRKVRPQTTVVTASTDSLYLALVPENFQNLPECYLLQVLPHTGHRFLLEYQTVAKLSLLPFSLFHLHTFPA